MKVTAPHRSTPAALSTARETPAARPTTARPALPGSRDELVAAPRRPLMALAVPPPKALAAGVGIPGWVAQPYPTTDAERAKELERIQGVVAEQARWSADAAGVLSQIEGLGVSPIDIWHGSHVVVRDGGALYDAWSQLPGAQPRISSHYPDVEGQQYELDFPPLGTLLFGKDAEGNTWFQMENHGASFDATNPGDYGDFFGHGADFAIHWASGYQNVGPLGLSPHSEKQGQQLVVPYPGEAAT